MDIRIDPASAETRVLLASWRYPPPYDFYDGDGEPMLNPERYYEARDSEGTWSGSTTSSRSRPIWTTAWAYVRT